MHLQNLEVAQAHHILAASTLMNTMHACQVFVALLRTTEQDGKKPLVRQALDVLAPALHKRLPPPGPTERFPIWVRYTKKVLSCWQCCAQVMMTQISCKHSAPAAASEMSDLRAVTIHSVLTTSGANHVIITQERQLQCLTSCS